jgi:histidinol-phosphate phosphatase family protein
VTFDVVIPSAGRPSLWDLLARLRAMDLPGRVIVADDGARELRLPAGVEVLRSGGRGPAAARNLGWRASDAPWIAFLDDDVLPPAEWAGRLAAELAAAPPRVAAVQGRIRVPLPAGRAPTDWERNVRGLEGASWATADMAFRRAALQSVGGFDERFPRAYREDSDLALRLIDAGWELRRGEREVEHPVPPADRWVSVRLQRGNADDALMRALHGRGWRERAGAPPGRLRRHAAIAAAAAAGIAAATAGRRRTAAAMAATWLAGTAELARARIAPGPRTAEEVATMALTSALIPIAATWHRLRGELCRLQTADCRLQNSIPCAVLFDRDGTLIRDVPYNGDPARVFPLPGAREALERLRRAGVPLAVISNQSGVARGLISQAQVDAVNERVDELLGPIGEWLVCPHGPDDGCDCRKPRPGLVLRAAERLGVRPERCAVVGDIGADVEAARAAGSRGVLVPTPRTRREEVAAAGETAPDLRAAVDLLIGGEP